MIEQLRSGKDFGAELLRDVGVLGQLVNSVGERPRGCIAAGDEEVDDLVSKDIAIYHNVLVWLLRLHQYLDAYPA